MSLVDVLLATGIAVTLTGFAVPTARAGVDQTRAAGAARFVAARLQQARVRAVTRGRDTAVRVTRDSRGYVLTTYEDGNRTGVLTRDVQDGTDPMVGVPERVFEQFPGVDFGTTPGLPGADGGVAPGTDPIRLGSADSITFSAVGTATSGSLYLRGQGQAQYVVRIYGETGRVRILRFVPAAGVWTVP
jgi:type II secretory pathway pseudopilin PulG